MSGLNALAVLDSQIAELRASGDTGNVENLVAARDYFSELIRRDEVRSLELEHARRVNQRLIGLLASIHMRCAPEDVTLTDGRVMRFVSPDPGLYWRELSEKVKSITEEMRRIHDEEDAAALARCGSQP